MGELTKKENVLLLANSVITVVKCITFLVYAKAKVFAELMGNPSAALEVAAEVSSIATEVEAAHNVAAARLVAAAVHTVALMATVRALEKSSRIRQDQRQQHQKTTQIHLNLV